MSNELGNHNKNKSTKLFLDNLNLKTGMTLVSPKGQFTTRGKTAQTGRAYEPNATGTLPDIDDKYDRSISNYGNGFVTKKVNNLFNQGKENNTRYGNLLKG
jgi:hypothetical protein